MADIRTPTYTLRLYVTGETPTSRRAIRNLQEICKENIEEGHYEIEVINVLEHPERAETERIVATPTLIKHLPSPIRRMVGDLSDGERVLLGLDLVQ